MAKTTKKKSSDAESEFPDDPLDQIAQLEDYLYRMVGQGQLPYDMTMFRFRKALDQAAKDDVWCLVDRLFARLVVTSYELFARASIELRGSLDRQDRRVSAPPRPDLAANIKRVEGTALFLLDAVEKYAKTRHVNAITSADDEKILDLASARRRARKKKARKKTARGRK